MIDSPRDEGGVTDDAARFDEHLGTEARVLQRSILIPPDGPLTPDMRDRIVSIVTGHIAEYMLSRKEVGRVIGFAGSVISQVLSGNYKGDSDAVLRRLNAWVESDFARRDKRKVAGFVNTAVVMAIRALLKEARGNATVGGKRSVDDARSHIVIGYGPAGCGKSVTAAALASEDPLVVLIRVTQRGGTDFALARMIVSQLSPRRRPEGGLVNAAIELLRDTGRPVIVDEAHRLSLSGCEFLRDLADVAGVPIILLCTEEFYESLASFRTGSGKMVYDQFCRRVGRVMNVLRGIDGKGGTRRPYYSLDDIRAMCRSDRVKIARDAYEYLQDIACIEGLGMCGLAVNAWRLAESRAANKPAGEQIVTAQLVAEAMRRLLLPGGASETHPLMTRIATERQRVRALAVAG